MLISAKWKGRKSDLLLGVAKLMEVVDAVQDSPLVCNG